MACHPSLEGGACILPFLGQCSITHHSALRKTLRGECSAHCLDHLILNSPTRFTCLRPGPGPATDPSASAWEHQTPAVICTEYFPAFTVRLAWAQSQSQSQDCRCPRAVPVSAFPLRLRVACNRSRFPLMLAWVPLFFSRLLGE